MLAYFRNSYGIPVCFCRLRNIFICLLFLITTISTATFAQDDRAVFDKTIDQFNRTTIGYVLEADQETKATSELAKQLAKPDYDLKQLSADLQKIYGSNSRTETLTHTISKQKINFIEGKPLTQQFAAIIQLIRSDRKGKPYLPDLEKALVNIKEAALKEAVTAASVPAGNASSVPENDQIQRLQAQVDDLQKQLDNLSNPTAMPASSSGVPLYVFILLGLVGALSLYNYWLLFKYKNRRRRSSSETSPMEAGTGSIHSASLLTEETNRKIKESATTLERKVDSMREQWKRDMEEMRKEIRKSTERIPQFSRDKSATSAAVTPGRSGVTVTTSETGVSGTAVPGRSGGTVVPGQTVELEVKKSLPVQEPEKPTYVKKYADYPKENGFVIAQLEDTSDRRSIYEINITPDHNKATFTIVNDPAIHEYAIQNRERLLRDACDFEISSSKHTRIEVVEPGTLTMDGNAWQIHSKAKIKFV